MRSLEGSSQIIDGDEVLSVYRQGPVTYADGKPVAKTETYLTITASVQPMDGRDLLLVPEGDRFKEQLVLFVRGEPLQINDRVLRAGVNYQVQSLESWGSYQQARIMRMDVGVKATP